MRSSLRILPLLLLMLVAFASIVRAEVSVEADPDYGGFILLGRGGGDGGSPWPWRAESQRDPALTLNSEGDLNSDGSPAFAIDPRTGYPSVVWAWFDGSDYEVVLSRWDGAAWSDWQRLTDNAEDDLDPSVSIDDTGTTTVSWWRPGESPAVWFVEGEALEEEWSPESLVNTEFNSGRYPSSALTEDGLAWGYQSDLFDDGPTFIVVARRGSFWIQDFVASTFYAGPNGDGDLDVQVHSRGRRLWVDWVDSAGVLAYSVMDPDSGEWSYPHCEPYAWDELTGETEFIARELARVRIRLAL